MGLGGFADARVLEFADQSGRIVISHDNCTMPWKFRNRLAAGAHAPGVFIVDDLAPIGACIEDLLIIAECSETGEWQDQIYYLPWK